MSEWSSLLCWDLEKIGKHTLLVQRPDERNLAHKYAQQTAAHRAREGSDCTVDRKVLGRVGGGGGRLCSGSGGLCGCRNLSLLLKLGPLILPLPL